MKVLVWSVIIFIFICAGIVIDRYLTDMTSKEGFVSAAVSSDGATLEERVMTLYESVLQRQPSSKEMIDATRNLNNGTWTDAGLRQRLIDSDEYQRMIKLQSNALAPELQKMVADRALIQRISVIYSEERKGAPVPEHMILPLKDVYVMLDYNEYSFRAFLRNEKLTYFEQDVKGGLATLEKETLQAYIEKEMGSLLSFAEKGQELAKQEAAQNAAAAAAAAAATTQTGEGAAPTGASTNDNVCRTVGDKDGDLSPTIDDIMQRSNKVFNKDELAKMLDAQQTETYQIPTKLHYGQMALRPDMSWSVPQQHPPVCTSLGQKSLTQPVMTNSKLLLGTSLEDLDASAPLMPPFEYKEYVPVQVQQPSPSSADATRPSS